VGHGVPGVAYGVHREMGMPERPYARTGDEIGVKIRNAGFKGKSIYLSMCFGGNDGAANPGMSVAQGLAQETGATTTACVGDVMVSDGGYTWAGGYGKMVDFKPIPPGEPVPAHPLAGPPPPWPATGTGKYSQGDSPTVRNQKWRARDAWLK